MFGFESGLGVEFCQIFPVSIEMTIWFHGILISISPIMSETEYLFLGLRVICTSFAVISGFVAC